MSVGSEPRPETGDHLSIRHRTLTYNRVVPLLQEYFYNDSERLRAVLGEAFIRAVKVGKDTAAALADFYDPDSPRYEIVELAGEELVKALTRLANGESTSPSTGLG
jgi:hypothetical protein